MLELSEDAGLLGGWREVYISECLGAESLELHIELDVIIDSGASVKRPDGAQPSIAQENFKW